MNHLAHFHLAGDDPGHLVGALLADYLRGPLRGEFDAAVETGVRLHRRIDAFTDAHPEVRGLRDRFEGHGRRLAGIVLDLCFDQCLARHWPRFDTRGLEGYGRSVYRVLREHRALLPAAGQRHAERMEEHGLLSAYADDRVIEGSLTHLGARLGMPRQMDAAMRHARADFERIERGFLVLYPELLGMAREFVASAASPSR